MKKLFVAVLVTLIGLAFTAPSFAIEHQFGGYWRVRMFTQKNFDGTSDTVTTDTTSWVVDIPEAEGGAVTATAVTTSAADAPDVARADTRTRLYYTAVINDNLKFVNKFEMDAVWGQGGTSYGDIGADGIAVEVKNSYADFNIGSLNAKVGTQGAAIQRGLVFDDDFSGIVVSSGNIKALYAKVEEVGANAGDEETMYSVQASFDLDTVKLTPVFTYVDSADDTKSWFLGLDVDATIDAVSLWGTFVYEGGEASSTVDISAWLAAAGMDFKVSDTMGLHGQVLYATGDDNAADTDLEAFTGPAGQCYYWSEIMGYGIFDNQVSTNSPACGISNLTAFNLGLTVAPMDKLTVSFDVWYAMLNEVAANAEDKLGIELDLVATYKLVDGLSLDLVGAYLFADDATTGGAAIANDENPWEVGTRLSLSF